MTLFFVFDLCAQIIATIYMLAMPMLVVYTLIPVLFLFVPTIMQRLFFLNFVRFPWTDYRDLRKHGVSSRGRNFYLKLDLAHNSSTKNSNRRRGSFSTSLKESKIGVWHILPHSLSKQFCDSDEDNIKWATKNVDDRSDGSTVNGSLDGKFTNAAISDFTSGQRQLRERHFDQLLDQDSHSIFIYLHGNSFDRAQKHRIKVYNLLSKLDFHILAVDYRGYGDSDGAPNENCVVEDARAVFEYARRKAPSKDIFIWGHSMGTGVASRLTAELSDCGTPPRALVLESPFNNLRDVVRHHWMSAAFRFLPWFDLTVIRPLMRSGLVMSSDVHVQRIVCPILVLHAADDHIIPVKLARKLVKVARDSGRNIRFIEFEADRIYKHKFIHRAPELPFLISEFVSESQLPAKKGTVSKRTSSSSSSQFLSESLSKTIGT